MSRKPLIAGNWKMNNTIAAAKELMAALLPAIATVDGVDVVVCPPFLALQPVMDSVRGHAVQVYAQNMAEKDNGAYTGEVSGPMLAEIEIHGVILGHSERRQLFGETDRMLQQKVPKALEWGLTPILCVGETQEERERGDTERKLRHQGQEALDKVPKHRLPDVVIAYEPIWAIGTGLTASPEQAQQATAFVRALVHGLDKAAGNQTRVLYGGSMNADNARALLAQPDIDGGLIGGASLDPQSFAAIVAAAHAEAAALVTSKAP